MRTAIGFSLTSVVLLAMVSSVSAQPPGPQRQQPRQQPAPTDNMSPGQLNQLLDAMLVMQAQDTLALSEQQYAQFLTRLKVLQETRRRNQQERLRIIAELQRMTNPRNAQTAAESEVRMRLTALQELEARSAAELRRAYTGIDEVLSPLQQARFRVLEEQIERRKLELVGRARQNNNPGRPNNQRPPPRR